MGGVFSVGLLTICLFATGGLSATFEETKKKAEAGGIDAQYNLGVTYANGTGVVKSL